MKAFKDIEALLRMIGREKEILKFLFTGRRSPTLRLEEALGSFLGRDEHRLDLLLEHGVVRLADGSPLQAGGEGAVALAGARQPASAQPAVAPPAIAPPASAPPSIALPAAGLPDGVLVLEDSHLRFFEEVLEVNEEINVAAVKQYIDALNEHIELCLTANTEARKGRFREEANRILRNIGLSTRRNVIDLKRNIDSTYKNERDYALKRKRLEQLDAKRADIALLVKEAERVMGERPAGFFGDTAGEVKLQLTEAYHNLLELDRQIIRYLNKIEAEQKLVEKVRRVKYLKDQLVWERQTDVLFLLQRHRPAFLEKRPKYGCLPSLEAVTGSADGLAALKEVHAALRHPTLRQRTVGQPLRAEDLSRRPIVRDELSTWELRSAFLGSSQDLMSFLEGCRFTAPVAPEDRLTLFCRIASEYPEDLRIGPERAESANYCYPLIYPKDERENKE